MTSKITAAAAATAAAAVLPLTLGIDIGRVIISAGEQGGDTSFLTGDDARAMTTPPMPGAFETIRALSEATNGRIWLVSKAGPRIAARSERWLHTHRFFAVTGVSPSQLRFCRKRGEKAGICATLGIDGFVDDRPDVLRPMQGLVRHRLLFGPQKRPGVEPGVVRVDGWGDVAGYFGI